MKIKEIKEKRNKKLNNDIQIIIDEILRVTNNNVDAIILYGSYGRNEGAFFFDEKGDVHTYNDYDILIITNKLNKHSIINNIKLKLQEILEIRWIDISQKTKTSLKKLKPTIYNFDLKYGSTVIYGDKKILNQIPKFESKDISLKEAETLYFTRLYTFIGSINEKHFLTGIEGEDARFFRNQMSKAILAIVDVLLLVKQKYHQSYKKRNLLIHEYYPEKIKLLEIADWALAEKLIPKDKGMSAKEALDFYNRILKIYRNEMYYVLSKFYKHEIKTTDDIKISRYFSFQEWLLRLKYLIRTQSLNTYQRIFNIEIVQSYFIDAYTKHENERNIIMDRMTRILQKIKRDKKQIPNDMSRLRKLIVEISR